MMELAAALHSTPNASASQVGLSMEARALALQGQANAAGEKASSSEVPSQDGMALGQVQGENSLVQWGSAGEQNSLQGFETEQESSTLNPDAIARLKAGSQKRLSDELAPKSATLSQKTIQQASSLNAGASMSGLKPWSKEWVFKGTEGRDPELKTLLQDSQSTASPENLLALLSSRAEAVSGGVASREASPKGQTRGIDGQKKSVSSEAADRLRGLSSATSEEIESLLMGADLGDGLVSLRGENGIGANLAPASSQARGTASLGGEAFLSTLQGLQQGGSEQAQNRAGLESPQNSTTQNLAQGAAGVRPMKGKLPQFPGGSSDSGEGKVAEKKQDPFEAAFGANAGIRSMENGIPGRFEKPQPVQVTGHVTQGAMTRERLSSESLVGLTTGIRDLSKQGGGEIRLRLKPESLGELNLRIVTRGNEVGLKIQASDPAAKKVIEESIQYLKESLASNSLQLTRFDVQVAGSGSMSSQMQNQGGGNQNAQDFAAQAGLTFDPNAQSGFSAAFGGQSGQGGSRNGELSSDSQLDVGSRGSSVRRPTASIPSAVMGTPNEARLAAASGRGRIDLFA